MTDIDLTGARPSRVVAVEEHFIDPEVNARYDEIFAAADHTPAERGKAAFITQFISQGEIMDLAAGRLEAMDNAGVDVQVVSYGNNSPADLPGAEGVELCRTANDHLAAACEASGGRLFGFATLPVTDPGAAVDELSRAVNELGLRGLLLTASFTERFDEDRFLVLFAKCAELGVPVCFHPGEVPEPVDDLYYRGGSLAPQAQMILAGHGIGWHYQTGVQTMRLVLAGVLDRCPDLDMVSGHWGELLPFFLGRMQEMLPQAATGLDRDIADYLHERFWYTPSGMYDERTARFCLEEFGADHVMWATDYPYRQPGDAKEFIGRLGLTEEEAEKVGHLNAERLFRLV